MKRYLRKYRFDLSKYYYFYIRNTFFFKNSFKFKMINFSLNRIFLKKMCETFIVQNVYLIYLN